MSIKLVPSASLAELPRKVESKHVLESIRSVNFSTVPGTTLTMCYIETHHGFVVEASSACVDPTLFDIEQGQRSAYNKAFSKLFDYEAYVLSIARHEASKQ